DRQRRHLDLGRAEAAERERERGQVVVLQVLVVREVLEDGVEQRLYLQRVASGLVGRGLADGAQEILLTRDAVEVGAGILEQPYRRHRPVSAPLCAPRRAV